MNQHPFDLLVSKEIQFIGNIQNYLANGEFESFSVYKYDKDNYCLVLNYMKKRLN